MPAFIDLPNAEITSSTFVFAGWIATNAWDAEIAVRINGKPIAFDLQDRPDVRAAPELSRFSFTSGVTSQVNLAVLPDDRKVTVELMCDRELVVRHFTIGHIPAPAPLPVFSPDGHLRDEARIWCEAHLQCPACHARDMALGRQNGAILCGQCGTTYNQNTNAINFISTALGEIANLAPTDNISANPYTPDALHLIETTVAGGGWVLDCGAGSRPARMAHVINVEIVDYPSTDVLAIGEALPFADNSFDAVLTLAVLEHVRDPFACAREIMRVLKPGGEILADVPFLQPLHGYPHHYYNMTQQGLINLFSGAGEVIECRVPLHGHPIFGIQWLLSQYLHGLPEQERLAFSRLTLGEVAALSPHDFLTGPMATMLPAEAQNIIGCLNSLRVRKI